MAFASVLELQPDDILILHLDMRAPFTEPQAKAMADRLKEMMPGRKVCVLAGVDGVTALRLPTAPVVKSEVGSYADLVKQFGLDDPTKDKERRDLVMDAYEAGKATFAEVRAEFGLPPMTNAERKAMDASKRGREFL